MMRLAAGVAAAKAVGTLARTAGRGGGTSLPGKVLTRVEPHAIGRLAQRLDRGSVVISATNGKTTTAAMVASILERTGARLVHNRAGANMAGGIASRAGQRVAQGRARPDRGLRAVRGRRVLARPGRRGARAARDAARQPLPRPARPLRRAGDDRRPLGRGRGGAGGPRDARAQRRRPAGGRPRPGARERAVERPAAGPPWPAAEIVPSAVYFGVDDDSLALAELQHASDSKHCRRCGHAYAYSAVYLAHLGHYRCPNCGQERPTPDVVATDVELRGIRSAAFTLRGRRGRAPAPRPLQRLQRARRGRADARASASRSTTSSPAWRPSRPRSAAPRRSTSAGARPRSCWSRTRPAPTRCCARSRSRTASSTCSACSTTAPRTAATSAGSGTPTGSCSSAACAASRASGTRAAELALRMKYAGPGRRPHPRRRRPRERASTRRWPTATARSTSSPPTPRCWSCASC